MQTFLPYDSIADSLELLDSKRLGKQRVEAKQILDILKGRARPNPRTGRIGWENHPAVLMWRGHEDILAYYYNKCLYTWVERGFKNSMPFEDYDPRREITPYPNWLYDPRFCISHQSNLIRKDPEYYRPIFGDEIPDNLEYFWPTHEGY